MVISGDWLRLHRVVANLLANARVHTLGGTTVTACLLREGELAIIEIRDTGPGIPPDLQATVFERFARGDSSRSRAAGSTGLGRAIVAAVVAAHGGETRVSSTARNTVVRVDLPSGAVLQRATVLG